MINKQITLYIGGTKLRQAGFSDLTIIGAFPAEEFGKMDRTTLISEKPVCVIKHTPNYVLYQLIDRKVTPSDHDTPGVLSIAMTIPNDMQLAEGKSPYTLLKAVYEKFRNVYMTSYSDGRDKFLDIKVEGDGFREIVAQYSLEKRKGRYVAMSGNLIGTLCVPQNKLEDLFRDSQYNEFANFKDIEIGSSCIMTPGLEHLEIPRPISYEVWVNGIKKSVLLSKPSESFATNLTNIEHYFYKNISFTLGELLDADNGTLTYGASYAKLDKENRKIICEVQKVEIKYRGTVKFIDKTGNKEAIQHAIENKEIHIEWGTNYDLMDYQTSGLEFEIPSRLLKNPSFSITPNKTKQGFILSVMPSIQKEQQEITIELAIREEEKKVVTPPVPVTRSGNKNGNNSSNFNKQSDKQKDQDDAFLVEERKRQTEERRLLIGKWFIIGFLSSLLLCSLGFGAYLMFKKDESYQLKEQIAEKDDKIQELERENKELKDDNGKLNDDVKILNDSIVNLKNKIKPSRDGIIATSDSNAKKKKNVAQDPKTILVNLIKEGKSYEEIQKDKNFSKLRDPDKWAISALFLQTNGLTEVHKRKIKIQIPEIRNRDYKNLTWERIKEIQTLIGNIQNNK